MNKKPFWKRVNRGFVVSMALIAVVLVYVVVTQLMLIPERNEISKLTDGFKDLMESTSQLTGEQIVSLRAENALKDEEKRLKRKLSELFVKDSGYIDEAVQYLMENIGRQLDNLERITNRSDGKNTEQSYLIDQDVSSSTVTYTYTVSGEYTDLSTDEKETKKVSDKLQRLYMTVSCKKVDGEWKIYRIGAARWGNLNEFGNYEVVR